MPAFRAKGFVCPHCKKLISYSPNQEGTTITCPRCGEQVMLTPDLPAAQQQPSTGINLPLPLFLESPRRFNTCLLWVLGGVLGVLLLILAWGLFTLRPLPLWVPEKIQQTYKQLVSHRRPPSITQLSTTLKNNDLSIAVTEMKRERPLIYQAAIHQAAPGETPVYCITLVISNRGKTVVSYRTWRSLTTENDIQHAAQLQDSTGRLYGAVSFGPQTWPVGTQQRGEIQPGESLTDLILFENGPDTPGSYVLTLPGENLGAQGRLSFRIPSALIH